MNNDVTDMYFATGETHITSLMVNGPKQSIPQYVNGGADSTLSSGRFTSDVLALGITHRGATHSTVTQQQFLSSRPNERLE